MVSRRVFILILVSVTALTGCPPKANKKENIRTGRSRLSPPGNNAAGGYSSNNPTTLYGAITLSDQQAIYYLAQGAATSPELELGRVNQQGDVFFWGEAIKSPNGQIDSARSRFHIEIYDDKYGQMGSDGKPIPPMDIHIGADQAGFIRAGGNPSQLEFIGSNLTIILRGSVQGGNYTGTLFFANANTGYAEYQLGQFTVPANGFFVGY